ncbi:MAG: hypothetical protein QW101_03335 [Ignisphaera sp.]|uniref:DUF47 family protein n=1 Tax=Ignisphaera aggregans TaxID=334771 RepID=A0A7J3MWL4_9CREN
MNQTNIVQMLENAVYRHSRYIERCKIVLKRISKEKKLDKLNEGLSNLVKLSKRLEEILRLINNSLSLENLTIEEIESIAIMTFYIYEVSIEEERILWLRYSRELSDEHHLEDVNMHLMRLDRLKNVAKEVLENVEKCSAFLSR